VQFRRDYVNPFPIHDRMLKTALTPAECRQRLSAVTPQAIIMPWNRRRERIEGTVSGQGFNIRPARQFGGGHLNAIGRFDAADGGTLIRIRLRPQWMYALVLTFAFPGILAIGLYVTFTDSRHDDIGQLIESVLLQLAMVPIVVGVHLAERWAGRHDEERLIQHVSTALQASESAE
jgi:hypothetical protein